MESPSVCSFTNLLEKNRIAKDAYKRLMQKLHDTENVLFEIPVTSQIID